MGEWLRRMQPARASKACGPSVFTDNGFEAPAYKRFHSLVCNDHSFGETSRSLPSGYQQAETDVP
jgi:hypothetical protein